MKHNTTELTIPSLKETKLKITYTESCRKNHFYQISPHIHPECEIYVNLSGDISFFCNGHIYPMSRGDILIARPGEMHHCIYRSNSTHRHYWILFDYAANGLMWDSFFSGEFRNVSRPSAAHKEEVIRLCRTMNEQELSDGEKIYCFYRLLTIIKKSDSIAYNDHQIPGEFILVLDYINGHLQDSLSVSDITEHCYISASTLERYFKKYTNLRPLEYIRSKKLEKAAELLRQGLSVSQCSISLGFSDVSYFIELFRKQWGMTPLRYKKHFK